MTPEQKAELKRRLAKRQREQADPLDKFTVKPDQVTVRPPEAAK